MICYKSLRSASNPRDLRYILEVCSRSLRSASNPEDLIRILAICSKSLFHSNSLKFPPKTWAYSKCMRSPSLISAQSPWKPNIRSTPNRRSPCGLLQILEICWRNRWVLRWDLLQLIEICSKCLKYALNPGSALDPCDLLQNDLPQIFEICTTSLRSAPNRWHLLQILRMWSESSRSASTPWDLTVRGCKKDEKQDGGRGASHRRPLEGSVKRIKAIRKWRLLILLQLLGICFKSLGSAPCSKYLRSALNPCELLQILETLSKSLRSAPNPWALQYILEICSKYLRTSPNPWDLLQILEICSNTWDLS